MKEFDKKSSPGREGFSKFLPASMSDSSTRRRLTEYEIQLQDLQAYVRSLEAETVHLRKKLEDDPAAPRYLVSVRSVGYRFDG